MLMIILQKNIFSDPIHDVIGGQGKKGTKFIIRQRNGLNMLNKGKVISPTHVLNIVESVFDVFK